MKILLLEKIHEDAVALLGELGEVRRTEDPNPADVAAQFADVAAVLTRGRGRIPRAAIEAGRGLRCLARCGAGTDNIDVAAATGRGLPVIFSPGGTTFAVAEHAIMLALAASRRLGFLDRAVKAGDWEVRNRVGLGAELRGKTLGVLGLGRIGRRIAELGAAFGMRVAYWSAHSRDGQFEYLELDDLFHAADVLSVSLALNPETRGLVDARRLGLMKPTAVIVNTARGEIMDEEALAAALAAGRIGAAGLDVLAAEPPPADHPLLRLENVVFTPHVAVLTDVAYRQMCVEVAAQVARVLRGGRPDAAFVRNPQVLGALSGQLSAVSQKEGPGLADC